MSFDCLESMSPDFVLHHIIHSDRCTVNKFEWLLVVDHTHWFILFIDIKMCLAHYAYVTFNILCPKLIKIKNSIHSTVFNRSLPCDISKTVERIEVLILIRLPVPNMI